MLFGLVVLLLCWLAGQALVSLTGIPLPGNVAGMLILLVASLIRRAVAGQHADAVLAHLAGGVAKNLVVVFQTDAEHGVGEEFHHRATHFKEFFFRHRRFLLPYVHESANIARGAA